MNKEDISDILEMMGMAEAFRPIATKGVEILKSFTPELQEIITTFSDMAVESTDRMVKAFEAKGYTREEAIALSIGAKERLQKLFDGMKSGKK